MDFLAYDTQGHGTDEHSVLSVADFIQRVNDTLYALRGRVQGEVTSIKKDHPTTVFFTMKDAQEEAYVDCLIWRSVYNKNSLDLSEGDEIIVTGTPEIYAPRGKFSLKAQTIEYAGEGQLKKQYEELKRALTEEGLFAPERKRALPAYPLRIGVITSSSGVVIQDFSSNLGRYGFTVEVIKSRMEGKDAIHELLASLKTMRSRDIDVLAMMRGGGSWESLQPFNTESVVRAVAAFEQPVIVGVGHDVDVTLTELVADRAVSTPTAVAETLNEPWDTLIATMQSRQAYILNTYRRHVAAAASTVYYEPRTIVQRYHRMLTQRRHTLTQAIGHVRRFFAQLERRIAYTGAALQSVVGSMRSQLAAVHRQLHEGSWRVQRYQRRALAEHANVLQRYVQDICARQRSGLTSAHERLSAIDRQIKLANPERNLNLGYSLTYVNGSLVRSAADLQAGDSIETRLADGRFTSEITDIQ
jgi:exodeoxyribonuclease VII large subunit